MGDGFARFRCPPCGQDRLHADDGGVVSRARRRRFDCFPQNPILDGADSGLQLCQRVEVVVVMLDLKGIKLRTREDQEIG